MFDEIDSVYSTCAKAGQEGWRVFDVEWPELKRFHFALKSLSEELYRHDLAEEWASFSGFFKRFRFFLATAPLAPAVLLEELEKWGYAGKPSNLEAEFSSSDPVDCAAEEVVKAFEKLLQVEENPLWRSAAERIRDSFVVDEQDEEGPEKYVVIVCPNTRLKERITLLAESLGDKINAWVVRPTELKDSWLYDQLIVFGPASRHQRDGTEFLFTSPRAESLMLYTPDFFPTKVRGVYDLVGSVRSFAAYEENGFEIPSFSEEKVEKISSRKEIGLSDEKESLDKGDPDKEWLESLPILRITGMTSENSDDEMDDDRVPSRPIVLAQESIAFLPEDGWVYRILECGREGADGYICETVEHTRNTDITVGDAILFSTEGGGEMIEEVADSLLGSESENFRILQAKWKKALLDTIRELGLTSVSRELTRMGAQSAQRLNVKNWCKPWNIAPGSFSDFEILLRFLDLGQMENEMMTASRRLRSAHRSAGFKLSERLIELMRGKELDELFLHGVQTFRGGADLPNMKTAYLVEMIIPEPTDVPRGETMKPVLLSDKSWL